MAFGCVPVSPTATGTDRKEVTYYTDKRFRTENHVYEDRIRTVRFYPGSNSDYDIIQPPVIPLGSVVPLLMEFDELGEGYNFYYYKIYNCNADWTVSMRSEIEYLYDFNEFRVDTYALSSGTRQPFAHYELLIPRVKLSGNYVVMVYRDNDPTDIIITRRFCVYENLVHIGATVGYSDIVSQRRQLQKVVLVVNYGEYELINPQKSTQVVLRQNYRWDNAITGLKPLYVKENEGVLDYRYFDRRTNFPGGNEFRAFDTRNLRSIGINVEHVELDSVKTPKVLLSLDRSRNNPVYSQYPDFNGNFLIENRQAGGGHEDITSDYVLTKFRLRAAYEEGKLYIFGALSDWQKDRRFLMSYNNELQQYELEVLLKQGYYNYQYLLDNGDPLTVNLFEGNYIETENVYDILFYYFPLGGRSDLLVGYEEVKYPPR